VVYWKVSALGILYIFVQCPDVTISLLCIRLPHVAEKLVVGCEGGALMVLVCYTNNVWLDTCCKFISFFGLTMILAIKLT
jgi:hypothetical protein